MKLIPLSDFVLERVDKISALDLANQVVAYTKFIKQPLTLEMFVPCYSDDKPYDLSEVEAWQNHEHYSRFYKEELTFFEDAKEKVLFEGFIFYKMNKGGITGYVKHDKIDLVYSFPNHRNYTIEDLCQYIIELTPSALEAIGIKE